MPVPETMDDASLDALGETVRDLDPGWEDAWTELCEAMLPRLQRQVASAGGLQGGAAGADDAVGDMLLYWHRKATEGTLLRHWTPEHCPVAAYLASRYIRCWARGTASRLRGRLIDGEAGSIALDDAAETRDRGTGTARGDAIDEALAPTCLIGFQALGQQGVTRPHLVAGLHLRPRLHWDQDPGPRVREAMPGFLATVEPDQVWEPVVDAVRTERIQVLERKAEDLRDQRYNGGRGVGATRERTIDDRLLKLRFQALWRPLDAPSLMALTGAKRAAADQYNKRYTSGLGSLITGFPLAQGLA